MLEKLVLRCGQAYVLQNIHKHSLNLLSFVYVVVFDVETVLVNNQLAILERLKSQPRSGQIKKFC